MLTANARLVRDELLRDFSFGATTEYRTKTASPVITRPKTMLQRVWYLADKLPVNNHIAENTYNTNFI